MAARRSKRERETAEAIRQHAAALQRWPGVSRAIDDGGGRFYFDKDEADRACDFFAECLTHHKGEFAGKPFTLDDWQRELIVRPLFGWRRVSDGTRRFRKVYLAVPKKNGKSPLGAGVGLYLLMCDEEAGAEVVVAAADREQAGVVFDTARYMVEDSEDLSGRCEVYRRSIVYPATKSSYKVLSSDVKTKHGPSIHGLIFDEFHAQPSRDLYDTLHKGTAARRQPVTMLITTAGDDQESICFEEHEYAERIITGVLEDDIYLPVIFAAHPEDDWRDPAVWKRVNPGLGTTVKLDYLESECRAAQVEPRKQNAFKRLHLNLWTQQATIWIPLENWDACAAPFEEQDLAFLPCAAGLDLSSKIDLTSFSVLCRELDEARPAEKLEITTKDEAGNVIRRTLSINYRVTVVPYFWMPEESLRIREKEDGVPYSQWAREGLLRVTDGNVVDYDQIYREITQEIGPRFKLKHAEIGYDPWNATQMALQLQAAGYQMVEVRQGYFTLSEPSKLFEALIRSRRLRHSGHKVLRWNISNLAVKEDPNENIRPIKPSKKKRIDGAVASIIGLSRLLANPDPGMSVYQRRGLLILGGKAA